MSGDTNGFYLNLFLFKNINPLVEMKTMILELSVICRANRSLIDHVFKLMDHAHDAKFKYFLFDS